MSRVLVFQFAPHEGPGYLAEFFSRAGVPQRTLRVHAGSPIPDDLEGASGLVLMGGPMSANDPLPWIPPLLARVRQAVEAGVPVLGHCLGGQLLARALGARVARNPVPEIGWHRVQAVPGPAAQSWLGALPPEFGVFQWHGETFAIPEGAERLLESPACANQAFVLGPHLGLQCHVEMTPELVQDWVRLGAPEEESESVQDGPEMLRQLAPRTAALHAVADALYARWLRGVSSRSPS